MADTDLSAFDRWSKKWGSYWPKFLPALRAVLADLNARLDAVEGGAVSGIESLQIGDNVFMTKVGGDFWWTVNAFWDGENWMRVDETDGAWGWQYNLNPNNMIWENYKACTFWHAQAAPNPLGGWATIGGWEMIHSFSSSRSETSGGGGQEFDGFGAADHHGYGRFQHAKIDGVTFTGVLANAFLDHSGVDLTTGPSWQAGIYNNGTVDKYRIARAPATGGGALSWADLLTLSSTGVVWIANSAAPAGNPSGGGYLYVSNGALVWKGSSGTVTTIAPA